MSNDEGFMAAALLVLKPHDSYSQGEEEEDVSEGWLSFTIISLDVAQWWSVMTLIQSNTFTFRFSHHLNLRYILEAKIVVFPLYYFCFK